MLVDWCRYFKPYLSILGPIFCPNYPQIAPIVNINDRKLPKKSNFWKRYYPSEITRERKIEALNIRETDKKNGSEGVRVKTQVQRRNERFPCKTYKVTWKKAVMATRKMVVCVKRVYVYLNDGRCWISFTVIQWKSLCIIYQHWNDVKFIYLFIVEQI